MMKETGQNRAIQVMVLTVSMIASVASAAATFSIGPTLATPSQPSGVTAADLAGDASPDLAVTSDNPNRILIFTNNSDGTFIGPMTIATGGGTSPGAIAAADIDNDGDNDIIVVLRNINTARVYTNTAGVFTVGAEFALGADAIVIRTGLLDTGPMPDFVTVNRTDGTISVVLNAGGAATVQTIAVGPDPRGVALGDLNNDTLTDIAVTSADDRTVWVLFNTGGGAFASPVVVPVNPADRPGDIWAADLTGDGWAELVVTSGNNVEILLNDGAGGLSASTRLPTIGQNPGAVRAADLDGDGDLELIAINRDSDTLVVFDNDGAGAFGPATPMVIGAGPEDLALADFNGSGLPGFAVANRTSGTTAVRFNTTTPLVPCEADLTTQGAGAGDPLFGKPDGLVTGADINYFVNFWIAGDLAVADITTQGAGIGDPGFGVPDGLVTGADIQLYVNLWLVGCP